MTTTPVSVNREHEVGAVSGWTMLPILLLLLLGNIALFIAAIVAANERGGPTTFAVVGIIVHALLFPVLIILLTGLFTLQPNEARVLVLFGAYKGTVRRSGFWWANPFYTNGAGAGGIATQLAEAQAKATAAKTGRAAGTAPNKAPGRNKISLRARTLNGEILKVNDKRGNPIEIAAVVIWRVHDTAQAMFDVENYDQYVQTQSESALRHLASAYAYDHGEEDEITLRSNIEEVSQALQRELQERLAKAGIEVDEARLMHLAYAPEIAQAMLRRQQAEAVIAARQKIVHGAVSMVDMALKELAEKHVVNLDDDRRAAMVSNLMVVLCGESEVHPVVNTGTLYT
jgi:regulator of protease activity HflC (stomatin/prohibitin superfamily)